MTPAQLQTIRDALDSERQYWTTIASEPEEVVDAEVAKVDDAKAALDMLVDSVRWRKQSKEPAPISTMVWWRDELHFIVGRMATYTRRCHMTRNCASLRHQLQLADQLAAHFAPIIADIKAMAANSTEPMCPKDSGMVSAFEIYSAARVQYEAEQTETVDQDVERRR